MHHHNRCSIQPARIELLVENVAKFVSMPVLYPDKLMNLNFNCKKQSIMERKD